MIENLTEREIDKLVVAQADDEDAWEKPIHVNRKTVFSIAACRPPEIASGKDVMSGEPVFRGTKVPVSNLFDNLESGISLDGFLENFPSVKREQAIQVLEYFKKSLSQLREAV